MSLDDAVLYLHLPDAVLLYEEATAAKMMPEEMLEDVQRIPAILTSRIEFCIRLTHSKLLKRHRSLLFPWQEMGMHPRSNTVACSVEQSRRCFF